MPKKVMVEDPYIPGRVIPVYSIREANNVMDTTIVNFDPARMNQLEDYILARVVASETVVTNNLYASYGELADLTVMRLRTGDVLDGTAVMYYIDIQDQYIKFIEATRLDGEPQVQYTNYLNEPLYWTDESQISFSTEVTAYPVMVYQYDADVKMQFAFINDGQYNIPKIQMGEGDGVTELSGKSFINKEVDGLAVNYYERNTGNIRKFVLGDGGAKVDFGSEFIDEATVRNIVATTTYPNPADGNVGDIFVEYGDEIISDDDATELVGGGQTELHSHPTYVHDQSTAAAVWNIAHSLGKFPSVTVVDSAGNEIEGDVSYTDTNNVVLTFSASFTGKAYLN